MPRRTIWEVLRPSIRSPLNETVPVTGLTNPRIVFIVVDLPEALPPSRQTSSPSRTWSEMPCSAWTAP
jgi:hypothetical protein